jgi:hypothetical protein
MAEVGQIGVSAGEQVVDNDDSPAFSEQGIG